MSNPVDHANLPSKTVNRFSEIYGDEDVYDSLELTLLHRIVLGLSSADLEIQLGHSAKEINDGDAEGRTPIWWAARRGDLDKVRILLEHGADPKIQDFNAIAPLHKAVADGGDECVAVLLDAGAPVDVIDEGGSPPIHGISFSPHHRPRTIELLVAHGADVNARSGDGGRPLHWCVGNWTEGTCDTIPNMRSLLDFGADIEAVDDFGHTAIMDSVYYQVRAAFDFLLGEGARLDGKTTRGSTILHIAAWRGTVEFWEILGAAAREGHMAGVDVYAGHDGHDALDCCTGKCRDKLFPGKRGPKEEEKEVFAKLMDYIERSSVGLADENPTAVDADVSVEEEPAVTVTAMTTEEQQVAVH